MFAVVLALASSLSYAAGDVLAGSQTRRTSLWTVIIFSQLASLSLMALVVLARGRQLPEDVVLPSLAAALFIFASWALLGEELSFVHVIGLLLSISLCVDYGIFFIENRGRDSNVTYHAIAASTLTTLASFGALGLGKTPTLPILAMSVSLGVTLGFLLCPLLIPKTGPA